MKDLGIQKKLGIVFVVMDVVMVFLLYCGYSTARKVVQANDPEVFLRYYNIVCIVMLVIMIVIMIYFPITILKSLKEGFGTVKDATKKLSIGDIEFEIPKEREDEFGELIDELNNLINESLVQAQIAEDVANGNLTIKVSPRGDKDLLGNALKSMVDRNKTTLGNISESAYQVMTSSSQVATASEALAQGSTQQASAIEEITASISEIAEKTKQNANQANEAASLVSKAIVDVKQGNKQMHEMMNAMQDINKASESISNIIKVIDDIAFQTNILALNAAVEAARAGEAGKGFAVVAEEVRNLAAKSADAASETAELIEDSILKVEAGSKIANETSNALDAITKVVSESEVYIKEIAESSNYQATSVAQINQAIGQVSQVVQNNSATSQECAAASEELSNQAVHMRELLSIYNLGKEEEHDSMFNTIDRNDNAVINDNEKNPNELIISLGDDFGKY
ncbi:MAG: methyl-accepting chemotaxis protein [Agathobacter sp.]|nr:methyl-accepting chemotaxis protein [Agathobacter sp.]